MGWATAKEEANTRATPLVAVRVELLCTECQEPMGFTGFVWSTNPGGYHHECPKCKKTIAVEGKQYPRIEYR